MFFFYILVWVIPFFAIAAALIDILRNEFEQPMNKLIWVLVVLFIPLVGAILYFVIGQRQKIQ